MKTLPDATGLPRGTSRSPLRALALAFLALAPGTTTAAEPLQGAAPATTTQVAEVSFWYPRLETNRRVTVWHALDQCETTGRIRNFRIAAGEQPGHYTGLRFNGSDFYKVLEGASRILANAPDPKLDAELDRLIASDSQTPLNHRMNQLYEHDELSTSRFLASLPLDARGCGTRPSHHDALVRGRVRQ